MGRTAIIILAAALTLTGCTLEFTGFPEGGQHPGYVTEVHYEPLQTGTYVMERGRTTFYLEVQAYPDHRNGADILLSVHTDGVKTGTFSGHLVHDETLREVVDGRLVGIHRDNIVFTRYSGSYFPYDEDDLSGTYEAAYRGAYDDGYGNVHILVPVPGTLANLTSADGIMTRPGWGGRLEGVWELLP